MPGSQFRPENYKNNDDNLNENKWNNPPVEVAGFYFGWRNALQIEQGKAKRRGEKRGLQIYSDENPDPGQLAQ